MRLIRLHCDDYATLGVILTPDYPAAYTMELPWRNNQAGISCLPTGCYQCVRVNHHIFGVTFQILENIPHRDGFYFHRGNKPTDSKGCILIGRYFRDENNAVELRESRNGFNDFMIALDGVDNFMLEIEEL